RSFAKALGRWLGLHLAQNVVMNPTLGCGQLAMRGAKRSQAAALLGNREVDVVNPGRHFRVEGQPAKLRDRESQAAGDISRRGQHRQAGSLQACRIAVALSQAAGDAASEEEDVAGLASLDLLGAPLAPFSRFFFLLLLESPAGPVRLDRLLPRDRRPVLDHLDLGTIALPFGADRVDLDELFR